jgi:hypothetical protein
MDITLRSVRSLRPKIASRLRSANSPQPPLIRHRTFSSTKPASFAPGDSPPALATAERKPSIFFLALVATAGTLSYSLNAQELKASPPNLDLILNSLERAEEQNPALSRPYEVTRQYKVFKGQDPNPSSEVTAQISFTPPDTKTFKIIEAQGDARGRKIIIAILEQEIASAKTGAKGSISRSNYDFIFLRDQNLGAIPEYVLTSFQSVRKRVCSLAISG